MDINHRIMAENPSIRNGMLQNHHRHLPHRPDHKWCSARHHQIRNRTISRHYIHYQREKVEMVWPCHRSQQSFHSHLKQKRQTKEKKKWSDIFIEWIGNHSQRIRYWHTMEMYGRSWSGAQLYGIYLTTPGLRMNDDDVYGNNKKCS